VVSNNCRQKLAAIEFSKQVTLLSNVWNQCRRAVLVELSAWNLSVDEAKCTAKAISCIEDLVVIKKILTYMEDKL